MAEAELRRLEVGAPDPVAPPSAQSQSLASRPLPPIYPRQALPPKVQAKAAAPTAGAREAAGEEDAQAENGVLPPRRLSCIETEPLTRLALGTREIGHDSLLQRLEGHRVLQLADVACHAGSKMGTWATIGVLVRIKHTLTKQGYPAMEWTLSDLDVLRPNTIRVWLHGRSLNPKPPKEQRVGRVFAVVNPKPLSAPRRFGSQQGSFVCCIDRSEQLLRIGDAAGLSVCKAVTEAGGVCGAVINRKQAEYCPGHMMAAVRPPSHTRTDLCSAAPLPPPKRLCSTSSKGKHRFSTGVRDAQAHIGWGDGATGPTQASQQAEARKEFMKRRQGVGARLLIQSAVHTGSKPREPCRNSGSSVNSSSLQRPRQAQECAPGGRPVGAITAAIPSQPPQQPPQKPAAPAADELLLDDEDEYESDSDEGPAPAPAPRPKAEQAHFSWEKLVPTTAAIVPKGAAAPDQAALKRIFGDVNTTNQAGKDLLAELTNVAHANEQRRVLSNGVYDA